MHIIFILNNYFNKMFVDELLCSNTSLDLEG